MFYSETIRENFTKNYTLASQSKTIVLKRQDFKNKIVLNKFDIVEIVDKKRHIQTQEIAASLHKYANLELYNEEKSAYKKHIVEKMILLDIYHDRNIDFVDSYLCALKDKYEIHTFNKKLQKCLNL